MLLIPETVQRIPRDSSNGIRTFTGHMFYPLDPRPEDVCIEDIAHSLSLLCRFTGHTYAHYSVADHSLRVSRLAEKLFVAEAHSPESEKMQRMANEIALWGLLHDASEAYLQDMPRPLKYAPGFGQLYRGYEGLVMDEAAQAWINLREKMEILEKQCREKKPC